MSSRFLRFALILLFLESLSFAGPGESSQDHCLEKALARLSKNRSAEEALAQRKLRREVQEAQALTNSKSRIDRALKRVSDVKPLKPSEVREFRLAAGDLKKAGRIREAEVIENRVASQEASYSKTKKAKISPQQEQLIQEKIKVSSHAFNQMERLDPEVRKIIRNQIFLKLAENPNSSGVPYKSGGFIDGISTGKFKKIRFSIKAEYRIIFRVNSDGTVIVEAVGSRESIYRGKFAPLGGSGK